MPGIGSISFLKFLLILGIILLLMRGFEVVMRKYLKVEKRKSFSYNHVNEQHKKIDWTIRISFVIVFTITFFALVRNSNTYNWYLDPGFLILVFLVISETTRAFMEWKYAENPKTYIFTISQLVFALILLLLLWISISANTFNFF